MDNREQDSAAKSGKWEVTLLFIGLLLTVVLAIVGWYMDGHGAFPR